MEDFSRVTGGGLQTVSVIPVKEIREDTGRRESKQFARVPRFLWVLSHTHLKTLQEP